MKELQLEEEIVVAGGRKASGDIDCHDRGVTINASPSGEADPPKCD